MTAANEDWTPPSARPDEVEGAAAEAVREKWALYSKTYIGVASLGVVFIANRYFQYTLPKGDAVMIADAIFSFLGMGSAWLIVVGRKAANAVIYWLPRSREVKVSKATGIPVSRLMKV